MATTRQSIIRGPGAVVFGEQTFHDADGITANMELSTQEIPSSIAGMLDTIKTDQIATISLTPVVVPTEDILDILYPSWLRTPEIGKSVFGSSDSSLVIQSRAGTRVAFTAAALTQCPDLRLTPVQTAFGSAQWTALVGNGLLPSATAAFYAVSSVAYALGEPDREGLTGFHYTATYGSLTISDTADGWTVSVTPRLDAVRTDSQGTIDYTLGGVEVTARCTPLGLTESQLLQLRNVGAGRGTSLAGSSDLVLTPSAAGGIGVTLKDAALTAGPLQWGTTTLRAGEIAFTAHIDSNGDLFEMEIAE